MKIGRKTFFDGFKANFDDTLDQSQVDGIEFLLSAFEKEPVWDEIWKVAYALATIFHETAGAMRPVEEGFYLAKYGPKRVKQFQDTLRYRPFFGRGYVQLTWKRNYEKAGKVFGVDLVGKPELALDRDIAFRVMTVGMHRGWFTGKKFADFRPTDFYNMRTIINGHDVASLIAGYARTFQKILKSSAAVPASDPESPTEIAGGTVPPGNAAGDPHSAAKPPTSVETSTTSETTTVAESSSGEKLVAKTTTTDANVVVEKEENLPLWQKLWKKFTAWIAGIGGTAKLQEYHDQFATLGIPSTVLKYALYAAVGGFLLWLVYEITMHFYDKFAKRWLTVALIQANSTPGPQITVAAPADLDSLERQGMTVVRR